MKIQILGHSASGKSTFAKKIASLYGLTPTYIDRIAWGKNWTFNDDETINKGLDEVLQQDAWVIDGNYSRFHVEKRLDDADCIYIFLFNRFGCLRNAFKRAKQYKHQSRESMGDECPEKLDLAFIWWILHKGRSKKQRKFYRNVIDTYASKVVVFKNHKQVENYLKLMQSK
jgi:adenylate kinase family enzyme